MLESGRVEQQLDDGLMPIPGSERERRLTVIPILRVDVGLGLEQVGFGLRHRIRLTAQRRTIQVIAFGRMVDPLAELHLLRGQFEAVLLGRHHVRGALQEQAHRHVIALNVRRGEGILRVERSDR